MAISFAFSTRLHFRLAERNRIRSWLETVAESHKRKIGSVNYLFTDDEEMCIANKRYLGHDTLTDIISFDDSKGNMVNGDIMISVERVKENAAEFGVSFKSELSR